MELSPQSVAATNFKTVKKGYDPAEVRSYLETLSKSIESLQSQATAMEARARAAVARLQEIAAQPAAKPAAEADTAPAASPEPTPADVDSLVGAHVDEAETISRTLLLAQRTADTTVAEAQAEAKRITDAATTEGRSLVSDAEETAVRLVEEAKVEARRAGEGQRIEVESEVQSLLARREFLVSDVDHLELHIITQRDRLRDVASALTDIVGKVPGGLGDIRRPLVSAVADDAPTGADSASAHLDGTDTIAEPAVDPVLEALESSSAVSGLDPDATQATDVVAGTDSVSDLDPIWSGRDTDGATVTDAADRASAGADAGESSGRSTGSDGTPPSGQANQFLFEDITSEVPAVAQSDSATQSDHGSGDDLVIRGDDLR